MRKILALLLILMMSIVFVVGCGDVELPAEDTGVQEELQKDAMDDDNDNDDDDNDDDKEKDDDDDDK